MAHSLPSKVGTPSPPVEGYALPVDFLRGIQSPVAAAPGMTKGAGCVAIMPQGHDSAWVSS